MQLSRRRVLASGLAATAAGAFGVSPKFAHAQQSIGDMTLDVVSDGTLTLPGGFVFDPMPKDELAPILDRLGQSPDILTPPCNVTLLRHENRVILFDVGSGAGFAPDTGLLPASLDAVGVSPEDITDVIFTHAHPDHLWGLLDDFDDPLFPEARFMIGRAEWDYWMNPGTVESIGEARASFAVGAKRRLELIEDTIEFFDDGQEVLPGIKAQATYGHTPGHMAFEVRRGAQSVMILGDSIGNDHIALAKPEWLSGADQDPERAAQTRLKLLDQLTHEQMQVVGYHLTGNGLGYIEKSARGFTFTQEAAK